MPLNPLHKSSENRSRLETEISEADVRIKSLEEASSALQNDYRQIQTSYKALEAEKHTVLQTADAGASQLTALRSELDASKRRIDDGMHGLSVR